MDDETRRTLEHIESRLDGQRQLLQQKIRDNAAWRDHWAAELDVLTTQVNLITAELAAVKKRLEALEGPHDNESQRTVGRRSDTDD